jgi:prepilin-type N-terminal cleavage/methylation domain-containing protein
MKRNTSPMDTSPPSLGSLRQAFTLVELLVVMAIIAILASLILAVVVVVPGKEKKSTARIQAGQIVQAVHSYHSTYSRYPVSLPSVTTNDLTCGGPALAAILGPGPWTNSHAEVIAILMDLETDGYGKPTLNQGHVKNPQRIKYLNAKLVSDTVLPGVGPDLVYRDPWGHPYIITLDVGYDDKSADAFYCRRAVSQQGGATGFNGLVNASDPGGNGDHFLCNGGVMVWSLGPDGKADAGHPAESGVNRDNLLNWKE